MRATKRPAWALAVGGLLAVLAGGCGIMGDLFNPALVTQLGIDPAVVYPPQGTVIVAFHNMTQFPATFFAFKSTSATDPNQGARNFSVQVDPGKVDNEVLDCPVGIISPGTFTGGSTGTTGQTGTGTTTTAGFDATAADIAGTDASGNAVTGTATYTGIPLIVNDTFRCGDVVEIQLTSTGGTTTAPAGGTGTQTGFAINVRIIRD